MEKFYLTPILALALTGIASAAIPGRTDGNFPLTGNQKALVILAEFDGTPFNVEDAYGYFNGMLTRDDFTDYFCKGSCSQYFRENSGGVFDPRFDVYGPVVLPKKASYYGANHNNVYDTYAHEMVIDACTMLEGEIDFSEYDTNADGVIDNVFIVYAGYGEASGGGADTIWPHAAFISRKIEGEPVILDGVRLDRYACVNEMEKDYPTGIGTFCHEFLHVLGLPDIYTTDLSKRYTTGRWDVMDHGSLNGNQRRPCNLTAYERSVLGWLQPEELVAGNTYTLPPVGENKGFIIRTESPSEFFFIENRQLQGWDKSLPGHGLLIWHIDYQADRWADNTVNNDAAHPCVEILKADGIGSEGSESGDPFPGTSGIREVSRATVPGFATWNGSGLGIAIRDITENADKSVSFRVEADQSSLEGPEADTITVSGRTVTGANPMTVTDISGRVIARDACCVQLAAPGIYIVSSGGLTKKIIVK